MSNMPVAFVGSVNGPTFERNVCAAKSFAIGGTSFEISNAFEVAQASVYAKVESGRRVDLSNGESSY